MEEEKKYDYINPSHYRRYPVEVIDIMERSFGVDAMYWYCIISAFKYRQRLGLKPNNPIDQDLTKEAWYLSKAAEYEKKRGKKLYVSGKISGMTYKKAERNFKKSESHWKMKGFDVINPIALDNHALVFEWIDYILRDIEEVFKCNHIAMQKNWNNSNGAKIEKKIAECIDKYCRPYKILYEEQENTEKNKTKKI
jgi:hypothetical protein